MKFHLLAVSMLCSAILAQSKDDAELQKLGQQALTAVEQHLDTELGRPLTFRYATAKEVEAILVKELRPQFAVQFETEDEVTQNCKATAAMMSRALLAKYAFESGDVLVVQKNFENLAEVIDEPGLDTPECLQAALVHECVHVLADHRYKFGEKLRELANADQILAYNAVIEGHAQLVARAVCKKNGWSEPFAQFTRSIGKVPDMGDEGSNMLARVQAVSLSWAYYDGERFTAKMQAEHGEEGIARAYRTPPKSPAEIFHPEWYLDPASRPKIDYDLDAGFAVLEEARGGDDWNATRQAINSAQIKTALALLPEEDVERFAAHILDSQFLSLVWKDPPGKHFIAGAVFVTDSHSETVFALAAEERLLKAKDEAMKNGALKILDASYTPLRDGQVHGLFAKKTVQVQQQKMPVSTVVLAQDRLVVELAFSNVEVSQEEVVALGEKMLAAMLPKKQD